MGRSYVHRELAERALIETQLRLGIGGEIATGLMRPVYDYAQYTTTAGSLRLS